MGKMKAEYNTTDEFKEDFMKNYTLTDIGEIMGWFKSEDIRGGMMVCPFHKEHTPSCQIGDHWYRCYACGNKGDLWTFGMNMEKMSYPEVVNKIAESLGCSIKDKLRISKKQLTMKKLEVEWQNYRKDMEKYMKSNKALEYRAGKLFPIECGYNRRDGRVVVPYTGLNGEIYGFTQRTLGDEKPKWKHSYLESSLTDNCATLIGVHSIKNCAHAYVVEGPGDIAGMMRAGFRNTVGVGGTSNYNKVTLQYLTSVVGLNGLTIVFDGDDPGRKASLNVARYTILNWYMLAEESYVVDVPDGYDPGDAPLDALKSAVENKMPMIKWYLKNISKQQLIYLFKHSIGKMVRKDIEEYVMDTYSVDRGECLKALMSSEDEYEQDDKAKLQAVCGSAKEFMQSDAYKNMTPAMAKSVLKRKYGIK